MLLTVISIWLETTLTDISLFSIDIDIPLPPNYIDREGNLQGTPSVHKNNAKRQKDVSINISPANGISLSISSSLKSIVYFILKLQKVWLDLAWFSSWSFLKRFFSCFFWWKKESINICLFVFYSKLFQIIYLAF